MFENATTKVNHSEMQDTALNCSSKQKAGIEIYITQCLLLIQPSNVLSCFVLSVIILISLVLNISSIFVIVREVRHRTHVNLLLSSQCLADLLANLTVMLPLLILMLTREKRAQNVHICLMMTFLDHWFHSVTMLHMAAIILDRYSVIVRRKLSAVTRRTRKSLALITVMWLVTFMFSISFIVKFLQGESRCGGCKICERPSKIYYDKVDEIINRILPFLIVFYCYTRIIRLVYKSRHRVGVRNCISNWKAILIGIYAKSVKTCLIIMTLFLVGTFPDIVILIGSNYRLKVDDRVTIFAMLIRFSLTASKPCIYVIRNGKWFTSCWFSSCCRKIRTSKFATFTRALSSMHNSGNSTSNNKVSYIKAHDLFSIKLQIEENEDQGQLKENINKNKVVIENISISADANSSTSSDENDEGQSKKLITENNTVVDNISTSADLNNSTSAHVNDQEESKENKAENEIELENISSSSLEVNSSTNNEEQLRVHFAENEVVVENISTSANVNNSTSKDAKNKGQSKVHFAENEVVVENISTGADINGSISSENANGNNQGQSNENMEENKIAAENIDMCERKQFDKCGRKQIDKFGRKKMEENE
eukprot:Seg1520.2 transcript_id=Seg1520.2/GoldUCD/mRNA.D3Y31 product="D-like dopamine receptor" protein_id=Seg1520.2/GoldUCD/D3Y31